MKQSIFILLISILFFGCTKAPQILSNKLPQTYLMESDFSNLPNFCEENYGDVLKEFKNSCKSSKSKKIYGELCNKSVSNLTPKEFLVEYFTPYVIHSKKAQKKGLLTGYYEAKLYASRSKSSKYKYPIYSTPKDLVSVDLGSIYPKLKNYRLRGRVVGNKLVPYDTREESKYKDVDADVLCYCDSKIDRFFLEIQGSGRAVLDSNETIFIGYDNQNGHRYRAIGRYLVEENELRIEDVSLQSIKRWLEDNPSRVDEVLNYNKSLVYFREKSQGATGAMGLELSPSRSIAVDRHYIPLGSMLYLNAMVDDKELSKVVFAQDTGSAIKGAVRADLFLGAGNEALEIAGRLKSELHLWILLPKENGENYE